MTRPLATLCGGLAIVYAISLVGMHSIGRWPVVPWPFILFLALISSPLAISLVSSLVLLPKLADLKPPSGLAVVFCVAGGVVLTFWSRSLGPWVVVALGAVIATRKAWTRQAFSNILGGSFAMLLGYGCVWNVNYVLATATAHRLRDPWLIGFDLKLLSTLGYPADAYVSVLPVVTNPWLVKLLENSYVMEFSELVVVLLLVAVTRPSRDVARWLMVLFGAYALGLAVFAIVPAVGPFAYQPDAFRPDFRKSFTFSVMTAVAGEYRQLLNGGPLTGFGYFVAMPSMHVAVATLAQRALKPAPLLYWTFLPINILLMSSTFLLGYHYFLDLPAGFLVAAVFYPFVPRADRPDSLTGRDMQGRSAI